MSGISEAFFQSSTSISLHSKREEQVYSLYMDSPPTIPKNFKYNSSHQPMFTVTETPLHYRSCSQNKFTFEDISFSSYTKPKDPNPDKNRTDPTTDDTEISIFDAQKYFSSEPKQDDILSVPRLSSVSSVDGYGRNFRTRSFHATPTASSEASWNSQSGLLANRPGSVRVSLNNVPSDHHKKKRSSKNWIFGRKCCCTGNKSVDVRDLSSDSESRGPKMVGSPRSSLPREIVDIHQPKVIVSSPPMIKSENNHSVRVVKETPTLKLENSHSMRVVKETPMLKSDFNPARLVSDTIMPKLEDDDASRQRRLSGSGRPFANGNVGFSFPILNNSSPVLKPELKGILTRAATNPIEDPPRDSIEVFQPNPMSNSFNRGSPITHVLPNMDDDMGSDASSDLFEIESFSTQSTLYPTYRRRDSLDDAPTFNTRRFASSRRSLDEPTTPSIAGTECYAPSEVSIDWSVTTAEGYDKGSVTNFSVSASEFGGAAFLRRRMEEAEAAAAGDGGKRKGGNAGGLSMMGCRQEKAVSVGPQPVKYTPAAAGDGPQPLHVGSRPPRAMKPTMGSCNSARLSMAFAA